MNKIKKRIILTGAQGTGKTTLMNALAKDDIRTISHIRKTAEANGIDMSVATKDGQNLFFNTLKKELKSKDSYISDRGLTCVAAYTFEQAVAGNISETVANKQYIDIVKFYDSNPDVLTVYVPIEFAIEDDGVRSIDTEKQAKIDYLIKNLLDCAKIPYITVHGSVEERVAQVENALANL
jgi:predicted ATPase